MTRLSPDPVSHLDPGCPGNHRVLEYPGKGVPLPAWGQLGQDRVSSFPGAKGEPRPQSHPGPGTGWSPAWLDFLGFPADLVIVVKADSDEKEAAGQEQQGPQRHEARLG